MSNLRWIGDCISNCPVEAGNHLDRQRLEQRDRFLWVRIGERDGESLCELFDHRAPAILGMLCKVLDRGAAEEVLQEVFRDLWLEAAMASPNGTSPFAWLLLKAQVRARERLRGRTLLAGKTANHQAECAC
jgi:DNA-directed RNA polymerase specialized sigma24 family protein